MRGTFEGKPMETLNKCHNFISEHIGIDGKYWISIEIEEIISEEK